MLEQGTPWFERGNKLLIALTNVSFLQRTEVTSLGGTIGGEREKMCLWVIEVW